MHDEEGMLPDPLVLTDKALHNRMKRNAYQAYSMGSMVQLEPLVDGVTERLKMLDSICESPSGACDLGNLLRYRDRRYIHCHVRRRHEFYGKG